MSKRSDKPLIDPSAKRAKIDEKEQNGKEEKTEMKHQESHDIEALMKKNRCLADFEILQRLGGKSCFGAVFKARFNKEGLDRLFAIKMVYNKSQAETAHISEVCGTEFNPFETLKPSAFTVRFWGRFKDVPTPKMIDQLLGKAKEEYQQKADEYQHVYNKPMKCMFLIMDYHSQGDLDSWIKNSATAKINLDSFFDFAHDLLKSVELMGNHYITHRDLKPDNILLTDDRKHLVIADFGTTLELGSVMKIPCDSKYVMLGNEFYRPKWIQDVHDRFKREGKEDTFDYRLADLSAVALILYTLLHSGSLKKAKDQNPLPLNRLDVPVEYESIIGGVICEWLSSMINGKLPVSQSFVVLNSLRPLVNIQSRKLDESSDSDLSELLHTYVVRKPADKAACQALIQQLNISTDGKERTVSVEPLSGMPASSHVLFPIQGRQCYALGMCYLHGGDIKQDQKEAVLLFRRGADQDDPNSAFALGECYFYGYGVPQKQEEAKMWYRKAEQLHHPKAKEKLTERALFPEGTMTTKLSALFQYLADRDQQVKIHKQLKERDDSNFKNIEYERNLQGSVIVDMVTHVQEELKRAGFGPDSDRFSSIRSSFDRIRNYSSSESFSIIIDMQNKEKELWRAENEMGAASKDLVVQHLDQFYPNWKLGDLKYYQFKIRWLLIDIWVHLEDESRHSALVQEFKSKSSTYGIKYYHEIDFHTLVSSLQQQPTNSSRTLLEFLDQFVTRIIRTDRDQRLDHARIRPISSSPPPNDFARMAWLSQFRNDDS